MEVNALKKTKVEDFFHRCPAAVVWNTCWFLKPERFCLVLVPILLLPGSAAYVVVCSYICQRHPVQSALLYCFPENDDLAVERSTSSAGRPHFDQTSARTTGQIDSCTAGTYVTVV